MFLITTVAMTQHNVLQLVQGYSMLKENKNLKLSLCLTKYHAVKSYPVLN